MQFQKIVLTFFFSLFISYLLQSQCLSTDHSTNANDSWLSCEQGAIPNNLETANYHWIYYDLGYNYSLDIVKIWNYNVNNATGKGIKEGEIFHSENGENWISGGTFDIPQASGQNDYIGWEGIDLKGITARFITIVGYSNWENSNCIGLSEVRFSIKEETTAIKEQRLPPSELVVFPNPSNQVLSIKLKNKRQIQELILVNSAGHEVFRMVQPTSLNGLDVSAFPAGMYYIKVLTREQEYVNGKFVKVTN